MDNEKNSQFSTPNSPLIPPGYKRTDVGVMPEDWEVVPLKRLIDPDRKVTYGIVVPGPIAHNGVPMIRAQDYSHGWVDLDDLYRVSFEIDKSYKRSKVITGDVLLTIVGSVGNLAKVPSLFSGSNLTQQTARLAFRPSTADADYYLNVLLSKLGKKEISNYTKAGVQPSLNLSDVEKFLLPYPPLPEQRAAAEALNDFDTLIESLEQLIAKKRQLKQGAMQELLTGTRRLPEFADETVGYKLTEGGVIPGDWEVKALGSIAPIATGNTPPTQDAANYGDEFLFVSPADLGFSKRISHTEKMLSKKGFSISRPFPKGSVLFVCIGSTIGKCGIASETLTSNQQINAILPSIGLSPDYLYYALSACAPKIKSLAGEQAVPIVNKAQFSETEIGLPSTKREQNAITEVLSEMDAEIEALQAKAAKARELKQGMMHELLTGRIRLI